MGLVGVSLLLTSIPVRCLEVTWMLQMCLCCSSQWLLNCVCSFSMTQLLSCSRSSQEKTGVPFLHSSLLIFFLCPPDTLSRVLLCAAVRQLVTFLDLHPHYLVPCSLSLNTCTGIFPLHMTCRGIFLPFVIPHSRISEIVWGFGNIFDVDRVVAFTIHSSIG